MKNIQTLHSHTSASDGVMNHLEVLKCAKNNGISVVAFTDHDSLPSVQIVEQLKKQGKIVPNWIIGIEISAGLPTELGGEPYGGVHMVGLFVDPFNPQLVDHCKKAQQGRRERMTQIVANLQGLGFDISVEACLSASGGESVGRPHIVKALWEKASNLKVVERIRKDMERASLNDINLKKRYEEMMQRESQLPYVLFLSDDAFIKGVDVDYGYRIDFDTAVRLIRDAGGLAILAHYSTAKSKISWELLEKIISERRLDGVETVYAMTLIGTKEGEEWRNDSLKLEELVKKHRIIASGGADAHTKQHFIDFGQRSDYNSKTIGMAEKMITQSGVSTTWSSF
mgnify:CR=1 FL=1